MSSSSKIDFRLCLTAHEIRYEIPALITNKSTKAVLHVPTDCLDDASTKCIVLVLQRDDIGPRIDELHLSHSQTNDEENVRTRTRCKDKDRNEDPFFQIIQSLKQSIQIQKLVISDTSLNISEISALSSVLYDISSLSSLVLRQCSIDHRYVRFRVYHIITYGLHCLISCYFSLNNTHRGATKISCALASNKSLISFDFSNNPIGNKGASSFCVGLEINTTLKKLKLSGANVGIEGAISIASAISNNSSLEVLDLSRNRIGDMGASKIAIALKSNNTLHQLSLRQNSISEVGALCISLALYDPKHLQRILSNNHSIRYLNLNDNEVSRKCLSGIECQLRMNLRQTEKETVRMKVSFFLRDERATSCFVEDDKTWTLPCLPYLISSIGKTDTAYSLSGQMTSLYNLLRNVHMPAMFETRQRQQNVLATDSLFSDDNINSIRSKDDAIPSFIQIDQAAPL